MSGIKNEDRPRLVGNSREILEVGMGPEVIVKRIVRLTRKNHPHGFFKGGPQFLAAVGEFGEGDGGFGHGMASLSVRKQ